LGTWFAAQTKMPNEIRTTHTGSLPRPDALLRALRARGAGKDDPSFERTVRDAVEACVAHQVRTGIDIVGDGEMSKPGYSTYVSERLAGFGGHGAMPAPLDLVEFPTYAPRVMQDPGVSGLATPACSGPISYRDRAALQRDLDNLKRACAAQGAREAFVTAASPGVIALFLKNRHYPTHEAYVEALAEAMRVEYEAIHDAGFLLQIDAPDLAMGRHVDVPDASFAQFRRRAALHIAMLNAATANIPPERMRLHLCWGNYEGPHHRDVAIAEIMDLIMTARPAGLSFVAANPRHEHEHAIWAAVRLPDNKYLMPGVIDTTTNFIEHPDLVAERILRFANVHGASRVQASTDCGFGTFAGIARVDPAIAWAKLSALVEGARRAEAHLRPVRTSAPQRESLTV